MDPGYKIVFRWVNIMRNKAAHLLVKCAESLAANGSCTVLVQDFLVRVRGAIWVVTWALM